MFILTTSISMNSKAQLHLIQKLHVVKIWGLSSTRQEKIQEDIKEERWEV